ncbi:MAG: fluoride efflux transporter CrcB [Alphaproteobacteria bacterium]|nr:fluoride efflux transporter CrcB [Alphaproteobacteria bacterium]
MDKLALLALGGALGTLGRYGIGLAATRALGPVFPYGTLAVNIAGGVLLGFLMQLSAHEQIPPGLKLALATGFCGAFTTFSTFSYETVRLAQQGATGAALLNVALNVALGLGGAVAGVALGRVITG